MEISGLYSIGKKLGVIFAVGLLSVPVSARTKLSLRDRQKIDLTAIDIRDGRLTRSAGKETVTLLTTVRPGTSSSQIEGPGVAVTAHIGDAFILEVKLDAVDGLLDNDAIIAAKIDESAKPEMLYARMAGNANVNRVHSDISGNLGSSFLGEGVVCGVFDIGFDVNHIDFYDNSDRSRTRVKKLVVFKGSSSTPEIDTEDEDAIKSFKTDKNDAKHGTHVLGIMAGGYRGPGQWNDIDFGPDSVPDGLVAATLPGLNPDGSKPVPYYGVAPKADIVICGNRDGLYGGAQLTGAQRIIKYAKSVGKPCVINYSLGSQWGPRDGSAPDDIMLSKLGEEAIICKSAGNDGSCNDYFSETLTPDSVSRAVLLNFIRIEDNEGELEFWLSDDRSVAVEIFALGKYYDRTIKKDVYKEFTLKEIGGPIVDASGKAATLSILPDDLAEQFKGLFSGRINISAEVMEQNDRYCIEMSFDRNFVVNSVVVDGVKMTMQLGVRFKGEAGQRIDGNCCGDYVKFTENKKGYVSPTPCLSIANGSCASNIFAVGSYSSRTAMRYLDNSVWTEKNEDKGAGRIAPSSGYGVLADGRSLPQVATPGVNIVSASSRYYNPDANAVAVANVGSEKYYFCEMSGTSMSCPLFAGICALWLEADPTLDYNGIMDVLEHTARKDKYTESEPVRYGFGKADAYEGLKYILSHKGTGAATPAEINTDHILVVPVDNRTYEITVGMGENFWADVYSLTGSRLRSAEGRNTVVLGLSGIDNGIYVLRVENEKFTKSVKIILR